MEDQGITLTDSSSKSDLLSLITSLQTELRTVKLENSAYKLKYAEVLKELNNSVRRAGSESEEEERNESGTVGLKKVSSDVRVCMTHDVTTSNTTINNCNFRARIHVPPEELLEALRSDQPNTVSTKPCLYQKALGDDVYYWSFMHDQTKSCDLILRINVQHHNEEGIRINVSSVEESDLAPLFLPLPDPHPAATKHFRLFLSSGTITLNPLPLQQSSFAFATELILGEMKKSDPAPAPNKVDAATGILKQVSKAKLLKSTVTRHFNDGGVKAEELFRKIASMFYDRFKQEDVIDRRMKVEFIKSISSAPPKSQAEEDLLAKSINQVEELTAAKRISGTVKESVEKYFLRSGESAGWGMAIAKMDISAVSLFAELWLIDTYAKRVENKDLTIRAIWPDLDGTRSLQYTRKFLSMS
ncbi:hypothetical protein TrVE_jg360 [Triparma verrucosa]|uniref:Uncharacterized protein n=1 Tax=Triparma verrucosa TaxID=1606542 RepID=A0A9W7KS50_9STRA|nr:hypothetical protein TrVE_jg360 [Triparma verrucosa]